MHMPSHVAFVASLLGGIAVLTLIAGCQVFWVNRVRDLGRRLIPNPAGRPWVGRALAAYAALWISEIARFFWRRALAIIEASASATLIDGPFTRWIFGPVVGFLMVVLRLPGYLYNGVRGLYDNIRSVLAAATADPAPALALLHDAVS
jgi:hypothetical protein